MEIKTKESKIKSASDFESARINYNFGKDLNTLLIKKIKEKLKSCFNSFTNMNIKSNPEDFVITTNSKREDANLFGFIQNLPMKFVQELPCVIKATSPQHGKREQCIDLVIYAKKEDIKTIKEKIKNAFSEIED